MTIKEIYEYAAKIDILVFSTIHDGEVHSRVAHFNGYDDEGIYFRTMSNRPYGRQLLKTGKVTVCGMTDISVNKDENNQNPAFPPGYSFRLIGEVKQVSKEAIIEKAKTNQMLQVAVDDMQTYPTMAEGNFVIYKAKGEIYDFDFNKVNRDHKLLRTRFEFGGAKVNPAGPRITEQCTECGMCYEVCTSDAIIQGSPYQVDSTKCSDCGSCINVCPAEAIQESLTL